MSDGTAGNDLLIGTAGDGPASIPATGIDAGAGVATIRVAGLSADCHIVQAVGGWLTATNLTGGANPTHPIVNLA